MNDRPESHPFDAIPPPPIRRSTYDDGANAIYIHAEHLRQLGQIAAGVSHDLRNIVHAISLRLQYLEVALVDESKEALSHLAKLRRDIGFAVGVLDRLRNFGRAFGTNDRCLVDLGDLAHEACELSKMRMRSTGVATLSEVHECPTAVSVCAAEVLSAAVNLIINAIDATAAGGEVVVRTGWADAEGWLEVSDTGPGLPAEVREHLFEPFITTKGLEGSGLGLCQVASCMRNHGGTVTVQTSSRRGTSFRMRFPMASTVAEPRDALARSNGEHEVAGARFPAF
jgi:signal transduction histidine kinase